MHALALVVFFGLGAILASFVGVVAARLNTGMPILSGRSRCDACDKVLEPRALMPIFSYFLSGGRAFCCGARLSPLAPFSELLLGALFALSYNNLGLKWPLLFFLIALALLVALVLYDLAHQILPTSLLSAFVLTTIAFALVNTSTSAPLSASLMLAGSLALLLALIHLFSRGRFMGLADAPFVFGLALLAGPLAFSGFLYSFWIGAIIGLVILAKRPAGHRMGVEVPFAPYLAAGFLLAIFTGWNLFTLIGP
ncbi:prepilin peptidase [Candidatus Kaiserbacteria bacterium]|nr:prepilin peptidase [Candidatus Kaiserbacteria bacterium]